MAELNPAYAYQNLATHDARGLRMALGSALGKSEGVGESTDLAVTAPGGMFVSVAAGHIWIKGDDASSQGTYSGYNDAAVSLAIGVAPTPGTTRWDLVCARSQDAFYSGASNAWDLYVIAGTAAASPVDPVIPNNVVVLARVVVASGTVAIISGLITDLRPRATAKGGIHVVNSARKLGQTYGPKSSVAEGDFIYETDTDNSYVYSGTAWSPNGIPMYASTAARDAAITSPAEGMTVFLNIGDRTEGLYTYTAGAWREARVPVPGFHAYNTVTQSIPNATFTQITFSTESYDHGSIFASSTFTVPAGYAGKWLLVAEVDFAANASGQYKIVAITRQTVAGAPALADRIVQQQYRGDPTYANISGNCTIVANAAVGDLYKVGVYQDSNGAQNVLTGQPATFFQATWLGG